MLEYIMWLTQRGYSFEYLSMLPCIWVHHPDEACKQKAESLGFYAEKKVDQDRLFFGESLIIRFK